MGSANRRNLEALAYVVGLAMIFPQAAHMTPQSYVTADLSRLEEGVEEMEYLGEREVGGG